MTLVELINAMSRIRNRGDRPTWKARLGRIEVSGYTIVTKYWEDAEWDNKKKYKPGRYPDRKKLWYESYLMGYEWEARLANISANYAGVGVLLQDVSQGTIIHSARGNWIKRVITELLGSEYYPAFLVENMLDVSVTD